MWGKPVITYTRGLSWSNIQIQILKPPWKFGQQLVKKHFDIEIAWHQDWPTSNPDLFNLVSDRVQNPFSFDLQGKSRQPQLNSNQPWQVSILEI